MKEEKTKGRRRRKKKDQLHRIFDGEIGKKEKEGKEISAGENSCILFFRK